MQHAKDSFYLALRDRLAVINPARTIVVNGAERPAILVEENESPTSAPPEPHAFYLRWGAARAVKGPLSAFRPLLALECTISYAAAGSTESAQDRGRALADLDLELLQTCTPPRTPKCDCTSTPPAPLGTTVFWGMPEFGEPTEDGERLHRTARLTIFFFPEVDVT